MGGLIRMQTCNMNDENLSMADRLKIGDSKWRAKAPKAR